MNGFESAAGVWLLFAVPFFGILCAAVARLSEGSVCQTLGQWVFLVALGLAGTATAVALVVGPGVWIACAASLAVMVLTAVCDFGSQRQTVLD